VATSLAAQLVGETKRASGTESSLALSQDSTFVSVSQQFDALNQNLENEIYRANSTESSISTLLSMSVAGIYASSQHEIQRASAVEASLSLSSLFISNLSSVRFSKVQEMILSQSQSSSSASNLLLAGVDQLSRAIQSSFNSSLFVERSVSSAINELRSQISGVNSSFSLATSNSQLVVASLAVSLRLDLNESHASLGHFLQNETDRRAWLKQA